jgi:ketosteroid isomerase-like protein
MAEDKAQIVRTLSNLMWNDRRLDAALELVHPEAVFDWSDSRAPYRGLFQGHAAIREAAQALWEAWDEWDVGFDDVIDVDSETVLIVTNVRARGKGSGLRVEAHGASLWSVHDGKIVYAKLFQSKDEALEAVRLSQAGSA